MTDSDCHAEIIAIGSEILLGQIHNAHAQYISQELAKSGLFVYHHSAIGDNEQRIQSIFELAVSRSNVVIVTGGLGPTADDLTKEALASFLQRKLILSETELSKLERLFSVRRRPMPEENKRQAYCIDGGMFLENPNGTAPGQYIEWKGVHFFLLPGPPLEMRPMLQNEVLPRLRRLFSKENVLMSRVLHFCGIGESDVDEQIRDLTSLKNPTVAPLASEGEMLLRITATGDSEAATIEKIQVVEKQLQTRFGKYIYGVDDETLASVIGQELRRTGSTLGIAESCTGGRLGTMITSVRGASDYFLGGIISYSNTVKQASLSVKPETLAMFGAVSEETAIEMAQGALQQTGATYGVSITGVAGPDGGTIEKPVGLVFVGIATTDVAKAIRLRYHGSREQIQIRSAKQALWQLLQTIRAI